MIIQIYFPFESFVEMISNKFVLSKDVCKINLHQYFFVSSGKNLL